MIACARCGTMPARRGEPVEVCCDGGAPWEEWIDAFLVDRDRARVAMIEIADLLRLAPTTVGRYDALVTQREAAVEHIRQMIGDLQQALEANARHVSREIAPVQSVLAGVLSVLAGMIALDGVRRVGP